MNQQATDQQKPDFPMYDAILPIFAQYMRKELADNFMKGDREGPNGWLAVKNNKFWISELYYHVGKLQSALMNEDLDRIKENTADIANQAMMVLDVKLDLLATHPVASYQLRYPLLDVIEELDNDFLEHCISTLPESEAEIVNDVLTKRAIWLRSQEQAGNIDQLLKSKKEGEV